MYRSNRRQQKEKIIKRQAEERGNNRTKGKNERIERQIEKKRKTADGKEDSSSIENREQI